MDGSESRRLFEWVKQRWLFLVSGLAATIVALGYILTCYQFGGQAGLPLDDSYIYLTYARQFARFEPFSYFSGGGYSAGATGILWPMLLSPLWLLGIRDNGLVLAALLLQGVLLVVTTMAIAKVVATLANPWIALLGVISFLTIAPATWCGMAGMEVGLAMTLLSLVFMEWSAWTESADPKPRRRLLVLLALCPLARPELAVLIAILCAAHTALQMRKRNWRDAVKWMLPIAPFLVWLLLNKILLGHMVPDTAIAKSQTYQPGWDRSFWWQTIFSVVKKCVVALFWDKSSPLPVSQLWLVGWLVGAFRLWWKPRASREKSYSFAYLLTCAPLFVIVICAATTADFAFQNYRYIAVAFVPLAIVSSFGLAVPAKLGPVRHAIFIALTSTLLMFRIAPVREEMRFFSQGARDNNAVVAALGRYIQSNLPKDAHIALHDAGAISYFGDRRVTDILGLVTPNNAPWANNGPGSRFEMLERIPPAQRPTHFAYYPGWLGTQDFFGKQVFSASIGPAITSRSLAGGRTMVLFESRWDAVHTGEAPATIPAGWRVVDAVDVADLTSEREHAYQADMGPRQIRSRTASWSQVHRDGENDAPGSWRADGGRTIRRSKTERFVLRGAQPGPAQLLLRTGGRDTDYSKVPASSELSIACGDGIVTKLTATSGKGHFVEVGAQLTLPAEVSALTCQVNAAAPYRSFHWYLLQPN